MFTGNEDHSIESNEAEALTARFRNNPCGTVKGEFFGRAAIETLLQQADCVGIRCYFGRRENDDLALVITGVVENGDDIYPGHVMENGAPCPPVCGSANGLNGE